MELPPNIVEKSIDMGSGLLASGGGRKEYFIKGTEPTRAYVEEKGYYVPEGLTEKFGTQPGSTPNERQELF